MMGATYGPFIWRKLPYNLSLEQQLDVISQFARLGTCLAFYELFEDGRMATFHDGVNKLQDAILFDWVEPTEIVLKTKTLGGSAPYSMLDLLEGYHILTPDEDVDGCEATLKVPQSNNIQDGNYSWQISVKSYHHCLQYLTYKLKKLEDDNASYWEYCDCEPNQFRAFYKDLINDLKICCEAKVIYVFDWT
jgi:hypothetical protein